MIAGSPESPSAPALSRPLVMGIVNVTPDSFSDGGHHGDTAAAVAHGLKLADEGADVLDVGGESTRPGAAPVSEADEIARVVPVIAALRRQWPGRISIDTMKPAVARAAVAGGADMWNDVSALGWTPDAADVAAELGCDLVLMHMKGQPRTMQADPVYADVAAEVRAHLSGRAEAAMAAGVARARIWLDPGIGFGKTVAHNLALVRALPALCDLGFPVLFGASRKRMIQALDPLAEDPAQRLGGSIALALAAAARGAAMVRVHDVRQTVQALRIQAALSSESTSPESTGT